MEDQEIIQLYLNRNEQAITQTASKYENYCTAIAMNILRNHEDAEECVNETYLAAWNTIPPHKPNVFSTFLGRITRNLSINKYKYSHAEKRGGGEIVLILDELAEIVSDTESTEDKVIRKELVRTIDGFLATLSAEKRQIFIRRYWYSDSISSIAKRFHRTENSVSVILNRIRKKLQKYLTERGYVL